jgi:hypothetical protein
MLTRAVGIVVALDATTAVDRTQVPERGACTLPIFIALVTNGAVFVAAVGICRTVELFRAGGETVIRDRIAAEAGRAIVAHAASDAAVL